MDEFEQREDEGLISYAIRRRNLPPDHPAHMSRETYDTFMRAGINQVERQQRKNIEMLRRAGMLHARI